MNTTYFEILNVLKEKENFDFEAYKMPMLIRRIDNRILKTNAKTPEQYLLVLENNGAELAALLNNFLINVSQFFRDSLAFDFLYEKVIPSLVSTVLERDEKSLRIWSAACAAGEEAYSLAILLDEYLLKEKLDIRIDFFATDYDLLALERAQKACYSFSDLEDVKTKYLRKYFNRKGEKYYLNSEIKSYVQFSKYNLLDTNSYAPSESIFGGFDIVLCRNVLIYFQEEAQNRIFQKFQKSLRSNGILFLGEAEMPTLEYKSKFIQVNDCCKIYRKVSNEN